MCSITALCQYLNQIHRIDMPPNQQWHYTLVISVVMMATQCSTLFILNMTSECFYSIIRPHKAASFNMVKRAKITIVSYIMFSIIFNLSQFWINLAVDRSCVPCGKDLHVLHGKIYYWLSF